MLPDFVTISRRQFDAVIFDLDGVLTDTARVHAAAGRRSLISFCKRGLNSMLCSSGRSI